MGVILAEEDDDEMELSLSMVEEMMGASDEWDRDFVKDHGQLIYEFLTKLKVPKNQPFMVQLVSAIIHPPVREKQIHYLIRSHPHVMLHCFLLFRGL